MAKVNLEIKGADKLIKKLSKFGDKTLVEIDQITKASADQISVQAKINAPKDIGGLTRSIAAEKIDEALYRIVAHADYAAYVEFGTGPKFSAPPELQSLAAEFRGRKTGNFKKGLDNIRRWAKGKGIPEDAAFPIFMSILRNGLTPHPFMYPAFKGEVKNYINELETMLKKLSDAV